MSQACPNQCHELQQPPQDPQTHCTSSLLLLLLLLLLREEGEVEEGPDGEEAGGGQGEQHVPVDGLGEGGSIPEMETHYDLIKPLWKDLHTKIFSSSRCIELQCCVQPLATGVPGTEAGRSSRPRHFLATTGPRSTARCELPGLGDVNCSCILARPG